MQISYLDYYGLKEQPFSTVPSPRYLFLTDVHSTALQKTAYVVGSQKGLAVVVGDTGTGKSSLARHLYQTFQDQGMAAGMLTNPSYPTPNSLLRAIAEELGTPRTDKSFKGMLDIFKDFLFEEAVERRRTVTLIIDEAQTMGFAQLELLRQLINYETNEQKLLQVVLFGQDELRDKLAHRRARNLKSRIVMASALERLTPEEVGEMIAFRWSVASGGGQHPFTAQALAAIAQASEGIPRDAAILADNALLLGFMREQPEVDADLVLAARADREQSLSREGSR